MIDFKIDDRVTSIVSGFYFGMPGRIIARSSVQFDRWPRWIVELDTGKKITLASKHLTHIDSEPATELEAEWRENFNKMHD